MLKFDILTLFPEAFNECLNLLPIKRALEKGLIEINFTNIRDFAIDKRGTVDDKTYGGGVGMLIRPEPIFEAVDSILKTTPSNITTKNKKIVLLSPRGEKFTQKKAREYEKLDHIIFICGRYEGIDARVEKHLADDVISIGDFVLSGGELPTMVIMEAVTRLIPGVLEKEDAVIFESFSKDLEEKGKSIEYPQYTRPEEYRGLKVPETLLSGNHKEIEKWRANNI
ncbi:tRNA (guanosine(37)-N1)-methyltransferase TrmD [candidate division WWE3 bacterium]|nr:tRNA (guanosine(37)-N1)-methyltransferase TrmD [candidate division WWE3 bacterium]